MNISFMDIAKARADFETYKRVKETIDDMQNKSMRGMALRIAAKHNISIPDLMSRDRRKHLVIPRQELMWECRAKGFSLPQIARFLGRDHTTILFGCRQHEKRMMEAAR